MSHNFDQHDAEIVGCSPLDLEVVRPATTFRIRSGEPLLQTDLINSSQVEGLLAVKMLDERVIFKWQIRWNEWEEGRIMYRGTELHLQSGMRFLWGALKELVSCPMCLPSGL